MDTKNAPSFAILRTKKHASLAGVRGVARHHFRASEVRGADPSRSQKNRFFGQSRDVSGYIASRIKAAEQRNGKAFQRHSIPAIEYVMTASPEWWQGATLNDRNMFFQRARAWLRNLHGGSNVVAEWAHLDEKTPHLHAIAIPFVADEKRLSAKEFLGGAAKLRELQTSFAAAVEPLGLRRGIQGSKSRYLPVGDYWRAVDSPATRKPTRWDYARAAAGIHSPALKLQQQQADAHRASVLALNAQRSRAAQVVAKEQEQKRRGRELMAEAGDLQRERESLRRGGGVLARSAAPVISYEGHGCSVPSL